MSDEHTISGDHGQPKGSYAVSAIGLVLVALCGLLLFCLLFSPIAEPDPRKGPVFVSAKFSTEMSYFLLTIGMWLGWLIYLLSGRQRRLAAARAKERVRSQPARVLVCALGLGWMLVAAYGALGGSAIGQNATAFVAFASVAPLGFLLWHVGYSTRERDRRGGSRYPIE